MSDEKIEGKFMDHNCPICGEPMLRVCDQWGYILTCQDTECPGEKQYLQEDYLEALELATIGKIIDAQPKPAAVPEQETGDGKPWPCMNASNCENFERPKEQPKPAAQRTACETCANRNLAHCPYWTGYKASRSCDMWREEQPKPAAVPSVELSEDQLDEYAYDFWLSTDRGHDNRARDKIRSAFAAQRQIGRDESLAQINKALQCLTDSPSDEAFLAFRNDPIVNRMAHTVRQLFKDKTKRYAAVVKEAKVLLELIDEISQSEPIGDEADRVFARYEFEPIRKALHELDEGR